jgi:hypothetical protein
MRILINVYGNYELTFRYLFDFLIICFYLALMTDYETNDHLDYFLTFLNVNFITFDVDFDLSH